MQGRFGTRDKRDESWVQYEPKLYMESSNIKNLDDRAVYLRVGQYSKVEENNNLTPVVYLTNITEINSVHH